MADKSVKTSSNGQASKSFEQQLTESVANVPAAIMKRVNALKNVQLKMLDIESKFYEDLHLLECKYAQLFEPLYEKRKQVITGEYEPTEDEGKWILDDDLDLTANSDAKVDDKKSESPSQLVKDIKSKVSLNEVGSTAVDVKGVPDFWLQTFRSVELISDMIQEHDEPVLKHLSDVRVRLHDQKPYGYTLEFHFNDNDFLNSKVLTKTYELKTEYDQKDPFAYEGPDLYKCKGCTIDWKKGKNVTVRVVKKKQKHKGHGTIRVISKEIKQDSFFNYFDTPTPPSDSSKSPASSSTEGEKKAIKDHADEDADVKDDEGLYAADFEIGHFFKERIIPKAVLYFTGEIADDECYDDFEDDEDDEDDDDEENEDDNDDDDDDDDDIPPPKGGKGGKGGNKPAGGKAGGKGGPVSGDGKNNPPECKQN
jgi:nucleosome assembly protein 1-like 1